MGVFQYINSKGPGRGLTSVEWLIIVVVAVDGGVGDYASANATKLQQQELVSATFKAASKS